jgi:hypothetical protein
MAAVGASGRRAVLSIRDVIAQQSEKLRQKNLSIIRKMS